MGGELQQHARARVDELSDTAASLDDVSHGRPFTPHPDVWKVRGS
ncbi:hypothetical protein [Arthrobacter gengyunqii]|nr:hypothetical protein [Arthrobacter gengyunqii]